MGVLVFDADDGRLRRLDGSGEAATLRPQAATLLRCLLDQPNAVIPRDALIETIWADGRVVDFEAGLAALISEVRAAMARLEPASTQWLETIPRRGLRLHVPSSAAIQPRWQVVRHLLVGVLILLAIAAGLLMWGGSSDPASVQGPDAARWGGGTLAVLPFERLGPSQASTRYELIAADRFLAQLWREQLDEVAILGRTSVQAYASREDLITSLVAELGVDWLVEGSVTLYAESEAPLSDWSLDVRLLRLPQGNIVWSDQLHFETPASGAETAEPSSMLGPGAAMLATRLASIWRAQQQD